MRELVAYLVRGVVSNPDGVLIREVEGESSVLVELTVAPEDVDRVRGPDGEPLQAIRTVLSASAGRRRAVLELLDGAESVEDGPTEEVARSSSDPDAPADEAE